MDPELGNATKVRDDKASPTIVVPAYYPDIWVADEDLVELRHLISESFRAKWDVGIAAYVKGDWAKAREVRRM